MKNFFAIFLALLFAVSCLSGCSLVKRDEPANDTLKPQSDLLEEQPVEEGVIEPFSVALTLLVLEPESSSDR